MKNIVIKYSLIVALVSQALLLNANTRTVISGKISNMSVYPTVKVITATVVDFRGEMMELSDSIKSDGTFKFEFDLYITQDIQLSPVIDNIIAHPGDSIFINVDFKNIGKTDYEGDGCKANADLNKYLNGNYVDNSHYLNKDIYKLNPDAFKTYCDSLLKIGLQKRDAFIKAVNPCEEIRLWTDIHVRKNYYEAMLTYFFRSISERKITVTTGLPYYFKSTLEGFKTIYNKEIFHSDTYNLLRFYPQLLAALILTPESDISDVNTKVMNSIFEEEKNELFKQLVLGSIYYVFLIENDMAGFEKYKAPFYSAIQQQFIKTPLDSYYSYQKEMLLNPKTKSDAIFAKMYDKSGMNVLKTIIDENKDKVIFFDFWSTGCGPCIKEFPNAKLMMQQFAGKKIQFVFICFGTNKERGEQIMAKNQLEGLHYYLNTEQINLISKSLKIKSIPHFMIVNKKGLILESGGYLRPMMPETLKKIENALNESD